MTSSHQNTNQNAQKENFWDMYNVKDTTVTSPKVYPVFLWMKIE